MSVKNKDDVLRLFDVLQAEAPISSLKYLNLPLSDEHFTVVDQDCDWTAAKSWVQWWIRPKHLQMLAKPFSVMQGKDWDKAPRNTNGVERANYLAKSGQNRPGLYAAMQSLYEKDKMFALQYIENGSKISYRTSQEENCRSQCSSKRIKGKQGVTDKSAKFGPPDKNEHFITPSKKVKEDDGEKRKVVEVSYSDGIWYKGWLSSFNFNTGKWVVQFYDDDETTEVSFPDKDVRLCE